MFQPIQRHAELAASELTRAAPISPDLNSLDYDIWVPW